MYQFIVMLKKKKNLPICATEECEDGSMFQMNFDILFSVFGSACERTC